MNKIFSIDFKSSFWLLIKSYVYFVLSAFAFSEFLDLYKSTESSRFVVSLHLFFSIIFVCDSIYHRICSRIKEKEEEIEELEKEEEELDFM